MGACHHGEELEEPGVDGSIIFRGTRWKEERMGMDWIDLAQDRDRWHALVNEEINFRIS